MPVTSAVVRLLALLMFLGTTLYCGASAWPLTAFVALATGVLMTLHVTTWLHLARMLLDWRPPPITYSTVRASDPREGHAERPDEDIIGPILERRLLPSAKLSAPPKRTA
jgi:hypothetical protein